MAPAAASTCCRTGAHEIRDGNAMLSQGEEGRRALLLSSDKGDISLLELIPKGSQLREGCLWLQ